jgi:hypothetical protein
MDLTNGTLLLGGGSWSSQQYFQSTYPGDIAPIPILQYVNVSSNQGTWLATISGTKLWVPTPGAWPIVTQLMPGTGGGCVNANTASSQTTILLTIPESGAFVNNTDTLWSWSPSCPTCCCVGSRGPVRMVDAAARRGS